MKLINNIVSFLLIFLFSNASCSTFDFSSIGEEGLAVVKSKVAKATQLALNYTVFNKTLSFKELDDFTGDGGNFRSYTLPPGSALKLFCGTKQTRKSGLISLYPPDIVNSTLAPMSKGGIHESLGRVIKNFDVFRSDRTLVHSSPEWFGGSYMFQHPYSAVIVSKDVDFTLNFACVYNPNSTSENPESTQLEPSKAENILYRWIQIKFTGVLPMPYGCGSGNYPLFSNLSFIKNPLSPNGPILQSSQSCEIVPEPGMIVGIYCAGEETFDEESCFRDSSMMTYYDPTFEHANRPGRLHLFKVPDSGFKSDVSFHCRCKDKNNVPTAEVRIFKPSVYVCDFTRIFESLRPRQKIALQSCRHDLNPGEGLRLIAPLNHTVMYYLGKKYLSVIEPTDLNHKTYVQPLNSNQDSLVKINDFIISKGFNIKKVDVSGRLEYLFTYDKDAVLIHKTEVTSLSYYWTLMNKRVAERQSIYYRTLNERVFAIINIGLVPTDPYTFGCGIRNEFFRNEFAEFKTNSENDKVVSRCTVDANKGPVGFYCPSPYLLEPRGCFKSVIVTKTNDEGEMTEQVRELDTVLKNGRAHKSTNLVLLEVYRNFKHQPTDDASKDQSSESPESFDGEFDTLMCKCMDVDGNVMASITVLNPNKDNVSQPSADESEPQAQESDESIGEIKTRIH